MKPLKVGEKVSSFSVNDHLGNPHSLEQYQGSKVVVFFYPKASTPGCTAEACDLRDHYKELKDAGYVLLGVSADTEKKQKAVASAAEVARLAGVSRSAVSRTFTPGASVSPDTRKRVMAAAEALNGRAEDDDELAGAAPEARGKWRGAAVIPERSPVSSNLAATTTL